MFAERIQGWMKQRTDEEALVQDLAGEVLRLQERCKSLEGESERWRQRAINLRKVVDEHGLKPPRQNVPAVIEPEASPSTARSQYAPRIDRLVQALEFVDGQHRLALDVSDAPELSCTLSSSEGVKRWIWEADKESPIYVRIDRAGLDQLLRGDFRGAMKTLETLQGNVALLSLVAWQDETALRAALTADA